MNDAMGGAAMDENTIYFLDLLGIDEENASQYSIRLNSGKFFNILDKFFANRDDLLQWIFTERWPNDGRAQGRINTPRVLQFIQLNPQDNATWLYVGGYEVGDLQEMPDGSKVYEYTPVPQLMPLSARSLIRYRREQGPTWICLNLNDADRYRKIRNDMTLIHVAVTPESVMSFPGFKEVNVTFDQLKAILKNDEWRGALGSVAGVYMLTDTNTGWHYVGSAYGRGGASSGLLSRWETYVEGDHTGGNKLLQTLAEKEGSEYIEQYFRYSVLEIFDLDTSNSDIIKREHYWMSVVDSVYDPDTAHPHGYNSKLQWKNTSEGTDAGTR